MNSCPRIAITGVGAVCAAGLTMDRIWNAVQSGQSAVAPIDQWDASEWPVRRTVVLGNLQRVFSDVLGEGEIRLLAQACYAHFARFLVEFVRQPLMSAKRRGAWVRVENMEVPIRAHDKGKGLLLLTGHFGNWEIATVGGIDQFPQYRGLFHFVRRPLKPRWLNDLVTGRFRRSGFGTLAKRGSLDAIRSSGSGCIAVGRLAPPRHRDHRQGTVRLTAPPEVPGPFRVSLTSDQ